MVSKLVGSLDATSGSVIAKHDRIRPSASGRSQRSFCSSLPAISKVCMLPSSGAMQFMPSAASGAAPTSWEMSAIPSTPTPRPPYSSGRCGVKIPRSRARSRNRSTTSHEPSTSSGSAISPSAGRTSCEM